MQINRICINVIRSKVTKTDARVVLTGENLIYLTVK